MSVRPKRRRLLVANLGIATITYTIVASPIACNLPNPEPLPAPDAKAPETSAAAPPQGEAAPPRTTH